jgi:hypothetical protein
MRVLERFASSEFNVMNILRELSGCRFGCLLRVLLVL